MDDAPVSSIVYRQRMLHLTQDRSNDV